MPYVGVISVRSITLDLYSKTWWNERIDAVSRSVEAVLAAPDEEDNAATTPSVVGTDDGSGKEWEPFREPQAA